MVPNEGTHPYCRKEKEIAEINADVKTIKRIVMGNGQEGLVASVPKLSQNVESLDESVSGLKTGLNSFLKFQENLEGQQEGKAEIRKRNRVIVGTLLSICSLLLVVVGILIGRLS